MTPTRIRTLLPIAAGGIGVGWALATFVDRSVGRLLPVPPAAAAALAVIALFLLLWGLYARPRLQRRPGRAPLDPLVATRTAALAMAASRTGSVLLGFYLGVALAMLPSWETPAGRTYTIVSIVAAIAGLALAAVGLWVEHICRLRGDDHPGGKALPES